jgi:hypothetical protein
MILLVILLILLAVGTGPYFPYSRGWGWGPSGVLWVILVIAVILLLTGSLGDVRL